jgi:glycosyltransferase involved in cell wall biosynthesis
MRIGLLSWESRYSVYAGGVANHVTELAHALMCKGHEVHVFTRMGDNYPLPYENIEGVHYHRCPFGLNSDFQKEIDNMCSSFVKHFFETEDHIGPFDIVHAHDWLTANALIWIKEVRGRKSVFTMHSTEYGRCGNNFAGGSSEHVSHIEWSGIYHADQVIAVSETLKKELNWLYSSPDDKVNVVYNGVKCKEFDGWIDHLAVRKMYEIEEQDPIVLFAGRMVYQKGPDLLMEAIPQILHERHNTKFVFAGEGGMRREVEETAGHMGVNHATRFLGHLDGWRLKDLFKTADIICVPSRNEPFGIVILEAWSAGKPVVASVNGGPSEFVWNDVNGLKINASSDSTHWGVNSLLEDLEHAKWMGSNGRKAAETIFSWDTIADETLNVYSN